MEHDFDNIRTGTLRSHKGKTRITIYLDDDVLEHFRNVATENGRGYQTEINASLRGAMNRAQVQARAHTQGRAFSAPTVMIIQANEVLEHLTSKHKLPSASETRGSSEGEPIHGIKGVFPFAREGKITRRDIGDSWQRGRA